MHIGILRIGQVDLDFAARIQENLKIAFATAECTIIDETIPVPTQAFNLERQQYRSDIILEEVHDYAERMKGLDRILGIVDADMFIPELSFVFGQADHPGKAAIISLWRLRPEFYGKKPDTDIFAERATKEAVHELGHTIGLSHCSNPFCDMYFSNSIFDTDRKQSLFCSKCYLKVESLIGKTG